MSSRRLRDGLVAGAVAGVLSGLPSTLHALATGRDPLDPTLALGRAVLPGERRRWRLLAAAALAHAALSLGWGLVLARLLPPRHTAAWGALAGAAIDRLDLGLVPRLSRRFEGVRHLERGPQLADHLAYGLTVGWVLALRRR